MGRHGSPLAVTTHEGTRTDSAYARHLSHSSVALLYNVFMGQDIPAPPNAQGTEQATDPTLAPPRPGGRTRALPPPRLSQLQRLPPPNEPRRRVVPQTGRVVGSPPLPQNDEDASSEEVDAMQRRVREILDEYYTKVSPVDQWPLGRRIRVRGVDIFYKVSKFPRWVVRPLHSSGTVTSCRLLFCFRRTEGRWEAIRAGGSGPRNG